MKCGRLLIIDDHRDSARMLAAVLELRQADLTVEVAFDGRSGLALALAQQHDAVLLDLGLPDMDGAEVATEIRRLADRACPVLIALSGGVAEVALHQSSGVFDHAFTKPVNVDRLAALLFAPG